VTINMSDDSEEEAEKAQIEEICLQKKRIMTDYRNSLNFLNGEIENYAILSFFLVNWASRSPNVTQ